MNAAQRRLTAETARQAWAFSKACPPTGQQARVLRLLALAFALAAVQP